MKATYVVTGGNSGLGLECVRSLITRCVGACRPYGTRSRIMAILQRCRTARSLSVVLEPCIPRPTAAVCKIICTHFVEAMGSGTGRDSDTAA